MKYLNSRPGKNNKLKWHFLDLPYVLIHPNHGKFDQKLFTSKHNASLMKTKLLISEFSQRGSRLIDLGVRYTCSYFHCN